MINSDEFIIRRKEKQTEYGVVIDTYLLIRDELYEKGQIQEANYDELTYFWFCLQREIKPPDLIGVRTPTDINNLCERAERVAALILVQYRPWNQKIYDMISEVGYDLNLFWNVNADTLEQLQSRLMNEQRHLILHPNDYECLEYRCKLDTVPQNYHSIFQYLIKGEKQTK